jgi:hypothetical protein
MEVKRSIESITRGAHNLLQEEHRIYYKRSIESITRGA